MGQRARWALSLLLIGVLAVVGIVEAARSDHAGLAGLLGLIEVVTVAAALSLRSRAPVALRADLVPWLDRTSATTGESPEQLANRAVSSVITGRPTTSPGS